MSTRFLGTWAGVFGTLLLLAAAGLQCWALADSTLLERLIVYTAILAVGGTALVNLGMACHRIARLEDRVKELERARDPAAIPAPVGSNG